MSDIKQGNIELTTKGSKMHADWGEGSDNYEAIEAHKRGKGKCRKAL